MISKKQENLGILVLFILFLGVNFLEYIKFDNILKEFSLSHVEYYLRIFVSGILGLIVGIDRTRLDKPLGIKTYTLIAIGSTLITIISILAVHYFAVPGSTQMDPMRLVAQLLPAVGFVGAGAIYFTNNKVQGLTSAAFVFFTASIGVGIGTGMYGITVFALLITFIMLKIERKLEQKMSN